MNLARRSITSITWKVVANQVSAVVMFVRSILLARWLPVEIFGAYALATSIAQLSVKIADFGMSGAFVHRAPETEDEAQAAAVQFTFRVGFTLIWAVLLIGGAFLFTSGQLRTALLAIAVTTAGVQFTSTPSLILMRRVKQRRVAVIQLLTTLVSTPIMLGLAWQGATLWALLANDLTTVVMRVVLLYVWRPVWRPRVVWAPPVMRYFLQFGSRNFLSGILREALDRADDIWVGVFLGSTSIGLYSRAYSFATYPRKILATPVNWVIGGTYAELKTDRSRLSWTFFNVNAILTRSGFFLAGLLSLVAPEFIRLGLGEKWLPMLSTFRLMLVFTLFDPIKLTVSSLISLTGGKPERVMWARLVQLGVMVIGLFVLGSLWGIVGVALAVDGMLVVGIAILFWQARAFADFSLRRLFAAPGVALIVGLLLASNISRVSWCAGSDWRTGSIKLAVFTVTYGIVLLALERSYLAGLLSYITKRQTGRQDYSGAPIESF